MKYPNSPERGHPAHLAGIEDGDRANIYFVTICTHERRSLLANDAAHSILCEVWAEASDYLIGRYVLMPDHIHLFCTPGAMNRSSSLKKWVSFWKSRAAQRWPVRGVKVWQDDFWDRQLRNGDSYSTKWEYVRANPVRAEFVSEPEGWSYQGEMNLFEWHD